MGAVQCLDVCPESAFVTSIGGENKSLNFRVIDIFQNPAGKTVALGVLNLVAMLLKKGYTTWTPSCSLYC